MLELELTDRDLAAVRLTFSPLWEAVMSVRVLKEPGAHPVHRRWLDQVRPRPAPPAPDATPEAPNAAPGAPAANVLPRRGWRLLSELVPVPTRRLPGFLSQPRPSMAPDLGVELATLRSVPAAQVRTELDRFPTHRPEPIAALYEDPARELARLAETIEAYWETAIAPFWPRVRTLLAGDVLHRARLLAEGGAERLLNDVDTGVRFADGRLTVDHPRLSARVRLGGRGLLLTPSVFGGPRVFSKTAPPWQPTLRYPARGVATLWEGRPRAVSPALTGVLGRSRALLLTELDTPAATGALAQRTGLSPGGASQHLTALRAAGLVTTYRAGRYVLYARTQIAEDLVSGA